TAFAPAQCLRGQMDGDQRGATRGVDANRGTLQAESVGDATGGDTGCAAGAYIPLMFGWHVCEAARIVIVHNTDEDAALTVLQRGRINASPLQRFPGVLQQQPLLRIDGQRLAGTDAEKGGIEMVGVVEKAAFARVALAGRIGVGIVKRAQIPSTV